MAQNAFDEGQRFVDTLFRWGHNSWKVVNTAFKARPPISSQQILHPLTYLRNVQPLPIALRRPSWKKAPPAMASLSDLAVAGTPLLLTARLPSIMW